MESGFALPMVLLALLVVGIAVFSVVWTLQGPLRFIGKTDRDFEDRIAVESKLEHARALLLTNPEHPLDEIGVVSEWADTCTLRVEAAHGELTISETWAVTAPLRFAIWVDSEVRLSEEAGISGPIAIASACPACETNLIDTTAFDVIISRRLTGNSFDNLLIQNEAIEITPSESGPVRITDLEINEGMLLVRGDLLLAGEFKGKARTNDLGAQPAWPLIVVDGNVSSEAHEATWELKGVVAAIGDVFVAGPVEFEGTVIGKTAELFRDVSGEPREKQRILGFQPRIVRRGREEATE